MKQAGELSLPLGIWIEEGMLLDEFGQEYEDYMGRMKRLVPYIY